MTSNPSLSRHPFLAHGAPAKSGLLGAFFSWWGGELHALFGGLTGGRLQRIHWTGEGYTDATGTPCKRAPSRALAVWPSDRVLRRTLTLPQAAENDIDAAIRFELGRHLPFAADQAVYHTQTEGRDDVKGQITLEITVLRRQDVERALEAAHGQGTQLAGLLAGETLVKGSNRRPWSGLEKLLGLCLVGALAAAAYLPQAQYAERLSALSAIEADLTKEMDRARAVAMGRQAPAMILSGLAAERRARPSAVMLLEELTDRLPDQSWIRFMTVETGTLKLEGSSASAAEMISHLETSKWISGAKFLSPTVTDPVTGLERYRITATVTPVWDAPKRGNP